MFNYEVSFFYLLKIKEASWESHTNISTIGEQKQLLRN
jgi:hypothetical protein